MEADKKEQFNTCLAKVLYFSDQLYTNTTRECLEEVSSFLLALELDNNRRETVPLIHLLRDSKIEHLRAILSKLDYIVSTVELIEDS